MTLPAAIFRVGHLERVPLGTPYPGLVAHVGRLLGKLPAGTELVIGPIGRLPGQFQPPAGRVLINNIRVECCFICA